MTKSWIKFEVPASHGKEKLQEWCNENCRGRFSVRAPKRNTFGYYKKCYIVKFLREEDAVAFKLQWHE